MAQNTPALDTSKPENVPANPVAALPADDLSAAASDIGSSLENNQAVSAKTAAPGNQGKPKADKSTWQGEPISNFKTDDKGAVIMRGGKPVRRGGKPAKARAGDRLAGGSTHGLASEPVKSEASRVVLPGDNAGGGGAMGGDVPTPASNAVEAGPEAGRMLSDLGFNTAERKGGEKWKPSDDEKEMIGSAASAMLNGKRLPWWLVLAVGVSVYIVTRLEFNKKQPKNKDENVTDAHRNRGPNTVGQDVTSQDAGAIQFPGL